MNLVLGLCDCPGLGLSWSWSWVDGKMGMLLCHRWANEVEGKKARGGDGGGRGKAGTREGGGGEEGGEGK